MLAVASCVSARAEDNSLLWQVTTPDGKVNHVFGTIHLQDSTVFNQRQLVLDRLQASRLFLAELDMDSLIYMASPQLMMLPDGKTLEDLYTETEYKEIRDSLESKLGPLAMSALRMKPAVVAGLFMLDDMEATASTTIDQFLWDMAGNYRVDRSGVEFLEEQIEVLDSLPPSILLEVIREQEDTGDGLLDLRDAYAREDLQSITSLVDSLSTVETFMQRLNDDRNTTMVSRLKEPFAEGGVFLAVGAAHLGGNQGLLQLLRNEGHVVEPVLGGERIQWLKLNTASLDD